MLDGDLWPENAAGYHWHNLILYLAGVGLLFFLLIRLGVDLVPAAAGTLFFSLAPYRVESVIWITSRKDVLSLLFALIAWHVHLGRGEGTRRDWPRATLASLALAAALLSKSAAVVVPPMIAAADIALGRAPWRRALYRAVPYLVLAASVSVLVPFLWQAAEMTRAPLSAGLLGRLALVGWSTTHYLETAVWPFALSPLYAEPETPLGLAATLAGPLLLAVSAAALVLARRAGRSVGLPALAFLWFVLGIAPFLNVIPLYYLVADRYLLFASLGISALGAWATTEILGAEGARRRAIGLLGVALVLLAWCIAGAGEARQWRSSERLWRHAVDRQPSSFFARLKLGETLRAAGNPREAADHYRAARRIRPLSPSALVGVFWSELEADVAGSGVDGERVEELVQRFVARINDGPGLVSLARDLGRMGLERAARVALERAGASRLAIDHSLH
jgi:hypothetical protein